MFKLYKANKIISRFYAIYRTVRHVMANSVQKFKKNFS